MDMTWLVPLLALLLMLVALVWALVAGNSMESGYHSPHAPKSLLARDGPLGGVGFLQPMLDRYRTRASGPFDQPRAANRSTPARKPAKTAPDADTSGPSAG